MSALYSNTNLIPNPNRDVEENKRRISKRYGADFYAALGGLYNNLTGKVLQMVNYHFSK